MTALLALPEVAGPLALLLRATLLMGAAWAAAAALRRVGASAAVRHMAWLLGIAALLALPVLWWLLPALRLPILPAEAAPLAAAPFPSAGGASFPEVPVQADWGLLVLAVYAAGAAALLLRLIVGRHMLKRLWRDAGALEDPAWETLLSRLCDGMGLPRRVELRIARGPAMPMTWGTLAPKVLLPPEASEWTAERRRLVLLHELAHVARRDSFGRSAASLACALYWFHPGAWFAARRMRMEQEHAADDRVLMAGGSPQAYALSLLDLAGGPCARPGFDQAAAMAGMYQLERRLRSITGPARRNRPGGLFLSSSALFAGLTTLLAAAALPVSASPTFLGSPEAKPADMASSAPKAVSSRAEDTRSPRLENSVERPDSSREALAPRAAGVENGEPSLVPSESEPRNPAEGRSPDRRQPAYAQQLRDYDWELRRDSGVQTGSPAASSRQGRVTLPTLPESAAKEAGGRPKWARNVPRLVQSPPSRAALPATRGPLVLSWSIEMGAKQPNKE